MIYLILFLEFFKIGLFTFGGGFAMIPLIEEVALKYGWMTESEFFDLIGVCESTPGPIAVNMATYIGSTQGGFIGSIIATSGVVLPSFIIILIIATVMKNLTRNRFFKGFMQGVKPVIVALIMSTGFLLLLKTTGITFVNGFHPDIIPIIIFSLITAVYIISIKVFKKKISSVSIIVFSAVLGIGFSIISETMII